MLLPFNNKLALPPDIQYAVTTLLVLFNTQMVKVIELVFCTILKNIETKTAMNRLFIYDLMTTHFFLNL